MRTVTMMFHWKTRVTLAILYGFSILPDARALCMDFFGHEKCGNSLSTLAKAVIAVVIVVLLFSVGLCCWRCWRCYRRRRPRDHRATFVGTSTSVVGSSILPTSMAHQFQSYPLQSTGAYSYQAVPATTPEYYPEPAAAAPAPVQLPVPMPTRSPAPGHAPPSEPAPMTASRYPPSAHDTQSTYAESSPPEYSLTPPSGASPQPEGAPPQYASRAGSPRPNTLSR